MRSVMLQINEYDDDLFLQSFLTRFLRSFPASMTLGSPRVLCPEPRLICVISMGVDHGGDRGDKFPPPRIWSGGR